MITVQPAPSGDILSVYAPIVYEVEASSVVTNPPIVKAQLYINGAEFGSSFAQPPYLTAALDSRFRFDLSEQLRTFMNNEDTFISGGNTNVAPPANEANTGFAKKCEFYVEFTVWQSTGLGGIYEASGVSFVSNTLFGLNIAVNQYIIETEIEKIGVVLPLRFMTDAPLKQSLSLGDKAYLSFFDTGSSRRGMRVQTFDATGGLLATAYFSIGQPLNALNRVRRLAVGTADIAALTSLVGVHYYTICVVNDTTAPLPLEISEVRSYFISAQCTKYSLHFLNSWGADDTIRFSDFITFNAVEKETYLANSPTYPVASNRGLTVLNSKGRKRITLIKVGVVNRLLEWHYQAQNSSVAYLQKAGSSEYIAVVIEAATDFEGISTEQSVRTVEIECSFSQIDYSHAN
jgi:hypothetical protein